LYYLYFNELLFAFKISIAIPIIAYPRNNPKATLMAICQMSGMGDRFRLFIS